MASTGERSVTSILFKALNAVALPEPFDDFTLDDLSRPLIVFGNYGSAENRRRHRVPVLEGQEADNYRRHRA
jgi:hypothetical protein